MKWVIFYADGSTFSDLDGEWKSAPDEGVQGVVKLLGEDEHGRKLRQIYDGSDWYGFFKPDNEFSITNTHKLKGKWVRKPFCTGDVWKKGLWIGDEEFASIQKAMHEV